MEAAEAQILTNSSNTLGHNNSKQWWRQPSFKIYLTHILSSWGDRMWSFAVGLYLVILYPESLLLTAIYGFASCFSVIILGAFIGKWIDKSRRITAARTAVVIQNVCVITDALILALTIYFKDDLQNHGNGELEYCAYATIIFVAVIAELASVACKIALQKDWIVVLAAGNEAKLSKLNAVMRTIDLTTFILAPIVVGQIITYISQIGGAIFIAGWNVFSAAAELVLLTQLFQMVPELSKHRKQEVTVPFVQITGSPESDNMTTTSRQLTNKASGDGNFLQTNTPKTVMVLSPSGFEDISLVTPQSQRQLTLHCDNTDSAYSPDKSHDGADAGKTCGGCKYCCCCGLKQKFSEAYSGWKEYFNHPVKLAGLALASLYMTVLGFDSITTGYVYSQGMTESVIGLLTAMGAIFGILGSLSFPYLRQKLGKTKVGIVGFGLETLCLVLCVISIFAEGSPFHFMSIVDNFTGNGGHNTGHHVLSIAELWRLRSNVFLLMGGVILARYGLWIADLSVTQIFQEGVAEDRRGVINGVQDSLNQLMSLLKFILVIVFPSPETFGYLVILSWTFVFVGFLLFAGFAAKKSSARKQKSKTGINGNELQQNFTKVGTISADVEMDIRLGNGNA